MGPKEIKKTEGKGSVLEKKSLPALRQRPPGTTPGRSSILQTLRATLEGQSRVPLQGQKAALETLGQIPLRPF